MIASDYSSVLDVPTWAQGREPWSISIAYKAVPTVPKGLVKQSVVTPSFIIHGPASPTQLPGAPGTPHGRIPRNRLDSKLRRHTRPAGATTGATTGRTRPAGATTGTATRRTHSAPRWYSSNVSKV